MPLSEAWDRHTFRWWFEPSRPQRTMSGLRTKFSICPSRSTHKSLNPRILLPPPPLYKGSSVHHKPHLYLWWPWCTVTHVLEPIYSPRSPSTATCISRLWRWARWRILFCGPTLEPLLATANTGNRHAASLKFSITCFIFNEKNKHPDDSHSSAKPGKKKEVLVMSLKYTPVTQSLLCLILIIIIIIIIRMDSFYITLFSILTDLMRSGC